MPRFDLDDLPNHFSGTTGDDQIFGNGGNDTLFGGFGSGNDDLFGGAGDDVLSGGEGKDRSYGGDGNDTIHAGTGDFGDLAAGGKGRDHLVLSYGNTNLGALFINVGSSFFVLLGGAQAISAQGIESVGVSATRFDDTVYGGIGNDYLWGQDGNDTFHGGAGDDWFDPGQGSFDYFGGAGIDTFQFRPVFVVNDPVIFDIQMHTTIAIGTASGRIEGVEVLDIHTGNGSDQIGGGRYDDSIRAYDGQNIIDGRGGNDTISTGQGDDLIWGRGGNDSLSSGFGRDTVYGGDGNDTINSAGVLVAGSPGSRMDGGAGNDLSYTGAGNDVIWGGTGNDDVQASTGRDTVYGGDGNDILSHSTGGGRLWGEAGDDMVSVYLRATRDLAYGGTGQDTLAAEVVNFFDAQNRGKAMSAGFAGSDYIVRLDGVEFLRGAEFEQVWMIGAEGNDTLRGGAGNDTLQGNGYSSNATDNDLLQGFAGHDLLMGNDGDDTLQGGAGNDILTGGRGADVLTGGVGRDVFRYAGTTDAGLGAARDRITDFVRGDDLIDLSAIDTAPLVAGDQGFVWRGPQGFTGTTAEVRRYVEAGQTVIAIDSNGDGLADMEIALAASLALTAADFML